MFAFASITTWRVFYAFFSFSLTELETDYQAVKKEIKEVEKVTFAYLYLYVNYIILFYIKHVIFMYFSVIILQNNTFLYSSISVKKPIARMQGLR